MSDDTWDDAKNLGNQVWQRLKNATSGAAESADRRLKITKLRRKLKGLAAQQQDIHRRIGEKVYQLHERGKVRNEDILEECHQIDEVREKIEDLEQKIRELQSQKAEEETELEDEDFLTDEADETDSGVTVDVEAPAEAEDTDQEPDGDESAGSETDVDVTFTSSEDSDGGSEAGDDETFDEPLG